MRYVDIDLPKPVSVIGLGTWQFGSTEWGYGEGYATGVAGSIVKRALELGVTLFDTAEIYGRGRSEGILGRGLRAADADPSQTFIATKIFPVLPVAPVVEQRGIASARRLGVRHLDLYQVHQANPVVRDATTMRGMQALQQVGLVGAVGVSNYDLRRWHAADSALMAAFRDAEAESLVASDAAPVVTSNQVQYSMLCPDPESDLIPFAAANRRMILAYSPLAQGLLSGRFTPENAPASGVRTMNPLFLRENLAKVQPLLRTLREVADAHDASSSQIALAWTIRHPQVAAIPGASSVEQLESNVRAADIVLGQDEAAALDQAVRDFTPLRGRAAWSRIAGQQWAQRRRSA